MVRPPPPAFFFNYRVHHVFLRPQESLSRFSYVSFHALTKLVCAFDLIVSRGNTTRADLIVSRGNTTRAEPQESPPIRFLETWPSVCFSFFGRHTLFFGRPRSQDIELVVSVSPEQLRALLGRQDRRLDCKQLEKARVVSVGFGLSRWHTLPFGLRVFFFFFFFFFFNLFILLFYFPLLALKGLQFTRFCFLP